jgi:PHD/YefM family antitoxin component YafN of YafNO toxin-antitoxin module
MSIQHIHTDQIIGITDLKRSSDFVKNLDRPIAILKRDEAIAYLISPSLMDYFMELADDDKLMDLVKERLAAIKDDPSRLIKVDINDL